MKQTIALFITLLAAAPLWAGGVPSQITYQGTLNEHGGPVTGSRTMLFRITDANGSTPPYWSSGNITIVVTQGLFSTILSPTGVDWQNVTPYIELSVAPQGQAPVLMLPREPITATAYSLISGTVIDGSITAAKLDPSVTNFIIPAGTIVEFAGNALPTGWLWCNGQSYAQSAYANLFAAIGTTWGPAGGSATLFNVPDMRGRVPVGVGQGAAPLTQRNLADTFGVETHTLLLTEMPPHSHSITDPGHTHTPLNANSFYESPGGSSGGIGDGPQHFANDTTTAISKTGITGTNNTGGDPLGNTVPFSIMQPSLAVNYIIKY